MQSKSTKIECICQQCGTSFRVKPSEAPRRQFCSRSCRARADKDKAVSREQYFWDRVQKTEGCWLWRGPTKKGGYAGYGKITMGRPQRKIIAAHRFSWELHFGKIPDGMFVCHRCDVAGCVRPDHLFLGTQADNLADMVAKGRQAQGEDAGNAKLKFREVRAIRQHHAIGGMSQEQLARAFNVSQRLIGCIIRGEIWKEVNS